MFSVFEFFGYPLMTLQSGLLRCYSLKSIDVQTNGTYPQIVRHLEKKACVFTQISWVNNTFIAAFWWFSWQMVVCTVDSITYFRHLHLNCLWDHLILWVLMSNKIALPRRVSAELPKSASSNAILDPIKVPVSFHNYFWTFPPLAPDEVSEQSLLSAAVRAAAATRHPRAYHTLPGYHCTSVYAEAGGFTILSCSARPPHCKLLWSINDVNYNWIHKRTLTWVLLWGLALWFSGAHIMSKKWKCLHARKCIFILGLFILNKQNACCEFCLMRRRYIVRKLIYRPVCEYKRPSTPLHS